MYVISQIKLRITEGCTSIGLLTKVDDVLKVLNGRKIYST